MNKPVGPVIGNRRMRNELRGILLLLLLSFGTEREMRAYTDPGSGAMIWQTLVVGLAGALYYCRRFVRWVRNKKESDE